MNFKKTGIIIRREYFSRVRKKSFLLTTFIVPILFATLCLLPTAIMMMAKEEHKTIAVVDKSGIVMPYMQDSGTISYKDCSGADAGLLKERLASEGYDALLCISALDTIAKSVSAESFSLKPLGVDMTESVNRRINDAVEAYRISSYNIDNLEGIMKDVKSNVRVTSYTFDADGKESLSESGVYMAVSMILGMIIYLFITLFCGTVMTGVIEEKSSRVVEVLISSVKSTELMFGKIVGVGLVAITQFLLWIVLTAGILGVVGGFIGKDILGGADPAELVGSMSSQSIGIHPEMPSQPAEMDVIVSTIKSLPLTGILVSFFIYFIFGFLLYASLFAAVGSAGESAEDTQQLQMPLTIPMLIGFFIALYAYKAPDSSLVFWGSMIPFTSPIVMIARIPYGVAMWELVLSIVILIASFIGCGYISAKIYKIGILMFGKKNSFSDLWKWLKMK